MYSHSFAGSKVFFALRIHRFTGNLTKQLAATLFFLRIRLSIAEEWTPRRRGELVFVDFIYDPRRRRGTTTSFESHRDLFSDNSESTYQTSDVCLGLWPRFDDGLSSADLHIPNRSFATLSRPLPRFLPPRHIPTDINRYNPKIWNFGSRGRVENFSSSKRIRISSGGVSRIDSMEITRKLGEHTRGLETNLRFNALILHHASSNSIVLYHVVLKRPESKRFRNIFEICSDLTHVGLSHFYDS